MRPEAVVFDFDGVILQSVDIKTKAFETLFAGEGPEAVEKILAFHRANGGISRFEKFRHAYREVLRRPLPPEQERLIGERFNALVEESVSTCAWVPGAREFLEAHHATLPLYVASGTPQEELRRIIERRRMSAYFRAAYGTPATKDVILRQVAASIGCRPEALLMVGDAGGDRESAHAVGADFIGIVFPGNPNPFPPDTPVLPDLTRLAERIE